MTFHHNKLTPPIEWREGWQSVDDQVKREEVQDGEVEWKQYLTNVEREEATNVAMRTRTAKPAMLPLGELATEDSTVIPVAARFNMDREKLRGMLDEWDELTAACDDAVKVVCNRYSMAV